MNSILDHVTWPSFCLPPPDMTFVSTQRSFTCTVRPLTTKSPTPPSSVSSCCLTRTRDRCSLWWVNTCWVVFVARFWQRSSFSYSPLTFLTSSFFVFFVSPSQISLDPPIKQGQTRYHFLILLFSKEEDINLTLNMSEYVPKTRDAVVNFTFG